METLILFLLLLLGVPVGNANPNSSLEQSTAAKEKTKNTSSTDAPITTYGGTGTWGENGIVIQEP